MPINYELKRWFRRQQKRVVGTIPEIGAPLPDSFPPLADYDDPMASAMTPLIGAYWHESGKQTTARLGLDADAWQVHSPHLAAKIRDAAFEFCKDTNATTSLALGDALAKLRQELHEGLVTEGESIPQLTKRVRGVFDFAEKHRAERIARTEAARAVHAAQEQAAIESGVVAGFEWLLSTNACPICHEVADKAGTVKLGQAFATLGDHPAYSTVRHPPLHPYCRCSMTEILKPEYGGPESPDWKPTIDQPTGEDYEEDDDDE